MRTSVVHILLWSLTYAQAQQIFIDGVPGYGLLNSCAEQPLSWAVRYMSFGCGDGSHTTSISCLCGSSSTHITSTISSEVLKSCPGHTDDVSSALAVFSDYCAVWATASPYWSGTVSLSTPTASAGSGMASNTANQTNPAAAATSTAGAATVSSSTGRLSTGARIAIAVIVPVVVLSFAALVVFLFMRKRRQAQSQNTSGDEAKIPSGSAEADSASTQASTYAPTQHSGLGTERKHTKEPFAFELESPGVIEKARSLGDALGVELPTDGRYGNGTSAHELSEARAQMASSHLPSSTASTYYNTR